MRPWLAHLSRVLYRTWCVACLACLAILVGARWLHYSGWQVGPRLDDALRRLMIFQSQSFLWSWAYAWSKAGTIALVAVVLIGGLHRRLIGRLFHTVDGTWRLRPAVVALVCGALVVFHYLFDLNPTVARVCAESLVLIALTSHPRVSTALGRYLRLGLWALAIGYWLSTAIDPIDRLTIATWVAFLFVTDRYLAGRMGATDLALLRIVAIAPFNLLPAIVPLLVAPPGGVFVGDGLAYSFCETPDGKRLYAALPACDSISQDYEHCRDAAIAEYDPSTLQRVALHRFFSPEYYGRFEMLLCLDDEVLVTVHGAVRNGERLGDTVMSFSPQSPGTFNPLYAVGVGATIALDAVHDSVFYSGEFHNRVVRYDRRTRSTKESGSPELQYDWVQPVTLTPLTGSQSLDTRSIHPGRNRIFVTQWMQGRYVHAIDLTTLKVVARYDAGGGGALGVAVDPERDRLFVSSLWGLEVFDLKTDRLIARKRLGLGNRPVIVDAARNRLYVGSTVEGKIRVLDRDTLDVIGQIPIGVGSRFAHLSRDGKRLFASSVAAHYYWDADTLAPASPMPSEPASEASGDASDRSGGVSKR